MGSRGQRVRNADEVLAEIQAEIAAIKALSILGSVKSVQRGVFTVAGAVTITAVTVAKSVIHCVSKGSAGYVAARGDITGTLDWAVTESANTSYRLEPVAAPAIRGVISGTRALSAGTTDVTAKGYSAVLTNSTTVTADGPCEWQVVEYN